MAKTAKAVATVQEISKAVANLPDFMQEHAGLGSEKLGAADVEVPRVKLMQQLSPELEEHNDIKAGDFFHTLAEMNFGNKVRITPIFVDQRYILWRPRKNGGGILARADDGIHWTPSNTEFDVRLDSGVEVKWRTARTVEDSGLAKWGSSNPGDPNSPPAATRMYNMVVTFPDEPDLPPAVITLQRAAIKVARRFIGKMKISRAPSFGLIFTMASVQDESPSGKFWNFQFQSDGLVTDKAAYNRNFDMYNYFKAQGINVKDIEEAQNDGVGDDAASDEGKPAF